VPDAITDAPADLRNGRRDILAANRLGHEVLPWRPTLGCRWGALAV